MRWIALVFLAAVAAAEPADRLYRPVSEPWKGAIERLAIDPRLRDELSELMGAPREMPSLESEAWTPVAAELEARFEPGPFLAREDAARLFIAAARAGKAEFLEDVAATVRRVHDPRTLPDELPALSQRLLHVYERSLLLTGNERAAVIHALETARQRYWRAKGADLLAHAGAEIPRGRLFPEFRTADPKGLLTQDVPLTVETAIEAFRNGIFPWKDAEKRTGFYAPQTRGVIDIDELHVPKSLAKLRKRKRYRESVDEAFETVVRACAATPRSYTTTSWIDDNFIETYLELHRRGLAHSVEVWDGDRLIGGLFGVTIDGVFFGQSMFHAVSNASKLAFLALADHLRARGYTWIDTETITTTTKALGAKYIPREDHQLRLRVARQDPPSFK